MTSRNGISVGRRGALRASLRTRSTAAVSSQIYAVQKFKMIHTLYRSGTLAFRARITAPSGFASRLLGVASELLPG